jgi:hypothetical protein
MQTNAQPWHHWCGSRAIRPRSYLSKNIDSIQSVHHPSHSTEIAPYLKSQMTHSSFPRETVDSLQVIFTINRLQLCQENATSSTGSYVQPEKTNWRGCDLTWRHHPQWSSAVDCRLLLCQLTAASFKYPVSIRSIFSFNTAPLFSLIHSFALYYHQYADDAQMSQCVTIDWSDLHYRNYWNVGSIYSCFQTLRRSHMEPVAYGHSWRLFLVCYS